MVFLWVLSVDLSTGISGQCSSTHVHQEVNLVGCAAVKHWVSRLVLHSCPLIVTQSYQVTVPLTCKQSPGIRPLQVFLSVDNDGDGMRNFEGQCMIPRLMEQRMNCCRLQPVANTLCPTMFLAWNARNLQFQNSDVAVLYLF